MFVLVEVMVGYFVCTMHFGGLCMLEYDMHTPYGVVKRAFVVSFVGKTDDQCHW